MSGFATCPECGAEWPEFYSPVGSPETLCDSCGWSSEEGKGSHFQGCPSPFGRPFDCDYCQERARAMEGQG